MERIEKLFDTKWGVVIFYVIVALIAFVMAKGINPGNNVSSNEKIFTTYYA